ncbi:MAG TPA: hypothetical protein VF487_18250 [Chitinophagaceae bacterium]
MKKIVTSFILSVISGSGFCQNSSGMPSGNIGIGTATPSNLLQVHNINVPANTIGSVSEIANFSGSAFNLSQFKFLLRRHALNGDWVNVGSRLQFVTDVTNQGYFEFNPQGEPYGLAIGTGATELMRFKQNGNIGIGTPDANGKLSVAVPIVNDAVTTLGLFGYSNRTDNRSVSIQQIGNTSTAHQYFFLNGGLGTGSALGAPKLTSAFTPSFGFESNDNNLHILTAPAGTNVSGNRAMSFSSNGNIGIGTSNPLAKFQIGDRFTFEDGGWKGIAYNIAWDNSLNTNARIVSAPSAGIYFTDLGNILFTSAPNGAAGTALNNGIHSLLIHNSGQVGIGTGYEKAGFQDLNYKLFVEGGIRARKVKVDQGSWPDFVFHPEYQLPSLSDLEKYIQENKHLPEVPSATEIEKNGLDLGDTQATLLKKIEELTLYIIEQDKRIQALEVLIKAEKK